MYRNILSKISITVITVFLLIFTLNAYSSDQWLYVGVAKTDTGKNFYLFLDKKKQDTGHKRIQFREKHDFNKPQLLPSGKKYNSVVITRIIDCKELKISDEQAIFKDKNLRIVDSYKAGTEKKYKDISLANNVNYEVFKIICSK